MKRFFSICCVFTTLLLTHPAYSQINASQTETAINKIITNIKKSFPPIELYVIAKQEEKIILEKPEQTTLHPGLELAAIRQGDEFTHPVTGVTLGRFEKTLGTIKILEIKENYCVAEIILLKPKAEIKRGDKARISFGKINVAVWPTGDKTFNQHLTYALEESERFHVLSSSDIVNTLGAFSTDILPDKTQLQKLAEARKLTAIIVCKINNTGSSKWLESKLISTSSAMVISKTNIQLKSTVVIKPNQ